MRFIQDVMLAEHAEAYIKQEQMEGAGGGSRSLSKTHYDVGESRRDAFQ
jgi:hypothetical protein